MADFGDPYAAMNTNPYLMPQAPAPDWKTVLGNALLGVGAGISSADGSGRGWASGIGPGLLMANQMTARQQQQAQQYAMMAGLRKAQEEKLRLEVEQRRQEMAMDQEALAHLKGLQAPGTATATAPPGMGYQPPPARMGPNTYGEVVASGESGGKYDIPNLQGSGAYGKYQFMPATWADVATKNPNLGLPFNMRQSTPQQQEAAFNAFTAGNAAELQKAGVQPTPENLYYAHRFGVDGAKRFIMAPPETPLPQLFPEWVKQNPDLNTTVGQFRLAQQGRFNGVSSGNPQISANGPPGAVQPPRVDPMQYAPLTMSKRLAPYGKAMIDIGNTETNRYLQDQDREMRRQQEAEKQALAERNAKVGSTGPNQVLIDAEAQAAAAVEKAKKLVALDTDAALKLTDAEMTRYSKDVRPAVEASVASLPNLYEMKRLTEGPLSSGSFIDARQAGARLLDTLGVQPMSDGMINRTEFNNRAGKNVLSFLQTRALGSGTGISEGDRKFVETMAAKGEYTTEEVKRLTDIAIESAHTSVKQHDATVKRLKGLPGVAKVGDDYWKVEAPTYKDWIRGNPAPGTETQQMGSTYQPQLDPAKIMQNIAQPKDKAAYDALPPGTPYLHPDGTFKLKPKAVKR